MNRDVAETTTATTSGDRETGRVTKSLEFLQQRVRVDVRRVPKTGEG